MFRGTADENAREIFEMIKMQLAQDGHILALATLDETNHYNKALLLSAQGKKPRSSHYVTDDGEAPTYEITKAIRQRKLDTDAYEKRMMEVMTKIQVANASLRSRLGPGPTRVAFPESAKNEMPKTAFINAWSRLSDYYIIDDANQGEIIFRQMQKIQISRGPLEILANCEEFLNLFEKIQTLSASTKTVYSDRLIKSQLLQSEGRKVKISIESFGNYAGFY